MRRWTSDHVQALLLSAFAWRMLPTPAIFYLNRKRVREAAPVPQLPATEWSRHERRSLLDRSEHRLQNIEGKGPGLAAVTAVVAAAVLLALSGWGRSDGVAKALLVLATLYVALSLCTPLYLVGPLTRNTLTAEDLADVAENDSAEEFLAVKSADLAAANDLQNIRLANHLDASRRELAYALAIIIVWALLVPVSGVLRRDAFSVASEARQPPHPFVYKPRGYWGGRGRGGVGQ